MAPPPRLSLSASIVRFLRAYEALSDSCTHYPWGTVGRNRALPRVHDANRAWIFDDPTPTVDELRSAISMAQRVMPVSFTQVEVVDVEHHHTLVAGLTEWLGPSMDEFVLMALPEQTKAQPEPSVSMTVAQRPFPGIERWLELIAAGHSDREALPDAVLAQLAARDTALAAVAGTRFFEATRDDERVAYALLISLSGVGLVDNVATLPAHRRRGAGTAVVAAVLAASAAVGNEQTVLFTRAGGDGQRLYERLGMQPIARGAQFRGGGSAC